jgi:2-dehydro-3-deoxygluconokinase
MAVLNMKKTIACIGESMVEVAMLPGADAQAKIGFGGDTLNTAIYMARLGQQTDFEACYVTLLGDDPNGDAMLRAWRNEQVCCRHVEQLDHRETGLYMINVDDQGERAFRYWRSSAPTRELFEGEQGQARLEALRDMDGLFFTGITLAILHPQSRERLLGLAMAFKQAGKLVAYDTNHRARLWSVSEAQAFNRRALASCNLALPSEEDLVGIFGEPESDWRRFLNDFAIDEIVLKHGGEPLEIYHQGEWLKLPLSGLDFVVDTTAAGDSFNAGYFAARWRHDNPREAALRAHHLASVVISYPGAIIPLSAMPKP